MPKYIVKSPIAHDGKNYEVGSKIDLSEEQAEAMPWAVEAVPEKKEEAKKEQPKK